MASIEHWHIEIQNAEAPTIPLPGFYIWRGVANAVAALLQTETAMTVTGDTPTVVDCENGDCQPTFYRQAMQVCPTESGKVTHQQDNSPTFCECPHCVYENNARYDSEFHANAPMKPTGWRCRNCGMTFEKKPKTRNGCPDCGKADFQPVYGRG